MFSEKFLSVPVVALMFGFLAASVLFLLLLLPPFFLFYILGSAQVRDEEFVLE